MSEQTLMPIERTCTGRWTASERRGPIDPLRRVSSIGRTSLNEGGRFR